VDTQFLGTHTMILRFGLKIGCDMRVLVEELLCQVVTEHILVLECLLSDARGRLWLYLVLLSIKCHRYPMTPALWTLVQYFEYPQVWLLGAHAYVMLGHKVEVDWADRW
jgi:hypothetical protein